MPNFGYANPATGHRGIAGGNMQAAASAAPTPHLVASQTLGIGQAKGGQQGQQQGGRGSSFMRGLSEARPAGDIPAAAGGEAAAGGAAAGGAEAAAGAGALEELAPLALLAL